MTASALTLRFESVQPGSTAGQMGIAFVQAVQKGTGYKIQVSTGKAVTKTALMTGSYKMDLAFTSPGINALMSKGAAMYSKVKNAKEAFSHIRGIINFPLGMYHYIVYADSGIKSFYDVKGKKLFLGPPGGIAPKMSSEIIKAVTGYEAGKDYKLMPFDWTSGRPAFSDRQMDLTGIPTNAPSPIVEEYAASAKLRLLGIPDDKLSNPMIQKVLHSPGRTLGKLDPKVYGDKVVNTKPVNTIQAWLGIITNDKMDEKVVYNMVKAYWDNLDLVHKTAAWMKGGLTRETALTEMNAPLHIGAYKYYKEAGFKIPDSIIPPEAK